jgi:rhodanese-related sulfurtransferase
MKSISVQELKELKDSNADFQLIDVREPGEFDAANLCGELIPLQTVPANVEKISKDKKVIVHCRSGKRSANAIAYLEQNHGYTNLYNLEGGIIAWRDEIDDSLNV